MSPHEQLLRTMYAAFNARDADGVLATMVPDVDWPNGWEGGRVAGQEEVRAYWERQWAEISPTVEPTAFTTRADGRIAVTVAQTVHSHDGTLLAEGPVIHVYTFDATGLVTRMDIEEPEGQPT